MTKNIAKVINDPESETGLSLQFNEDVFDKLGQQVDDDIKWIVTAKEVMLVNKSKELRKGKKLNEVNHIFS